METITQRRVTAGRISKPAGAMSSAFDVQQPAGTRKTSGLDPDAVTIRKGVPIPPTHSERSNRALQLLGRMEPGDCVELTESQARAVVAAARKAIIKVALRKLGPDLAGVWRL